MVSTDSIPCVATLCAYFYWILSFYPRVNKYTCINFISILSKVSIDLHMYINDIVYNQIIRDFNKMHLKGGLIADIDNLLQKRSIFWNNFNKIYFVYETGSNFEYEIYWKMVYIFLVETNRKVAVIFRNNLLYIKANWYFFLIIEFLVFFVSLKIYKRHVSIGNQTGKNHVIFRTSFLLCVRNQTYQKSKYNVNILQHASLHSLFCCCCFFFPLYLFNFFHWTDIWIAMFLETPRIFKNRIRDTA